MILQKIKDILKLVRWFHELLAILPFVGLFLIINYYAHQSHLNCELSGFNFAVLCICVQLLIAAGCVLNDIMDRKIDKVNKPHTHLVDRSISLKNAWLLFALLSLLILLLSWYITIFMFSEWAYISACVYVLSILYDMYFKKSPLMGNILIAGMASFIPLVLFLFANDCIELLNNQKINTLIYLYAAYPFLIIVPRELSLDISDMEGDRAGGCKTLPIVIGIKKSKTVVNLFLFTTIVFSFIMSYYFRYLVIPFLVTDALLLIYIYKLQKTETRIDYIRIGRFLWFVMILGLIGFTCFSLIG